MSSKGRQYLHETLTAMQIKFATSTDASGDAPVGAINVDCAGFSYPELAKISGLACDEKGRVLVNEHLQATGFPEIFVAGDAAAYGFGVDAISYTGCATASPMGTYTGEALANVLAGKHPSEFRYGFTFQCISLGRNNGLIQFLDKRTGKPNERVLTGRPAAVFKELICKMTMSLPKWERKTRWPFYTWRKTRLFKKIGNMAVHAA